MREGVIGEKLGKAHFKEVTTGYVSGTNPLERKKGTYQHEIGWDPSQDCGLGAVGEEELVLVHVRDHVYGEGIEEREDLRE